MGNADTRKILVDAVRVDTGERTLMTINVPTGSMDKPSDWAQEVMHHIQAVNWKLETGEYRTDDEARAKEIADCLDFYMGGSERGFVDGYHTVKSAGYYYYIGA